MITTKPSAQWPGYIDVFEDGFRFGSCPADKTDDFIKHHIDSHRRHWEGIIAGMDDRTVVANGHAYHIGAESGKNIPSHLKGFGGDTWLIHFHDGRRVECDSLWHYGDVPAEYRDRLPDNATLRPLR